MRWRMIKNELRYKGSVLSNDQKSKIETNISVDVFLFYSFFTLLGVSVLAFILMFVFAFFNLTVASYSLGTFVASLIVAVILVLLLEREVISKDLNAKLYIYFDLLEEFLEKGKSKMMIRMINRKLMKYLGSLEGNINNVFIFKSSDLEIQLVKDIKKLISDDLIYLLKRGKRDLLLNSITSIKETYLYAEGMLLTESTDHEYESEHISKIENLKSILKKCEFEKQSIPDKSNKNKLTDIFMAYETKTYTYIIFFSTLGVGFLTYINVAGDNSKVLDNISVVGFFLMIIIFIIQSKKK